MAVGILAAGRARRFGGGKVLAPFGGTPLVRHAVDAALASELRPIVVVVAQFALRIESVLPAGVDVVRAPAARLGIAHSLRALVQTLEGWRQVGAVCIGLADQPLVGPDAYRRLAAAYAAGADFAVATYAGERQNPVLIGRDLWPQVRTLRGDVGARALMESVAPVEVACDGTGRADDIDTPDDLNRIERETEH